MRAAVACAIRGRAGLCVPVLAGLYRFDRSIHVRRCDPYNRSTGPVAHEDIHRTRYVGAELIQPRSRGPSRLMLRSVQRVSDSVCPTRTVRAQTGGVWSLFSSWGRACPASRGDRERAGRRWARVTRAAVELARPTAHYTHTSTRGERGPAAKPVKKRSQGGKRAEACSARRRPAVCGRPAASTVRDSDVRGQGAGAV